MTRPSNHDSPDAALPGHTAILASAGTGKTFQLTSRCLALLAAGVDPQRILATTFTRLAAGEILQRILARLAAAALEPTRAEELSRQVGRDAALALSPAQWGQRLVSLVASLDRVSVSTLDAFFARLARGFALELGGDSAGWGGSGVMSGPGGQWQPADTETLAHIRDHAIASMLHSADRSAMLSLIRARASGLIERSVRRELIRAVEDAHAVAVVSEARAWRQLHAPPTLDPARLAAAIDALEHAAIPTTRDGSPRARWGQARERDLAAARRHAWEEFTLGSLPQCVLSGRLSYDRADFPPPVAEAYRVLLDHAAAVIVPRVAARNEATYQLMHHFDRALWEAKATLGVLAFDDVPRLLLGASLEDRLASLYFRLDATVSHILLDEFQDTSVVQWQLMEPLIEEVVSGQGAASHDAAGARTFFCVGDVKQSLYSWRDAEPDLLPSIPVRWPQVAQQRLAVNRRSSPIIIDAVNSIFGSLSRSAAFERSGEAADHEAASAWQRQFDAHQAFRQIPGHVALRTSPRPDDPSESKRSALLRFAAHRIAAIRAGAPGISVGVLFRAKKHIPLLRHILLQRHGIPASEEGGNPLSDSPRVAEILSLLTLADHPFSRAAAFHAAHSPLAPVVGLRPDRLRDPAHLHHVTLALRARLLEHGFAHTIQRWSARLAPTCDRHDRERLTRLVELAGEFEAGPSARSRRTRPFIELVESRRVEDPTAAKVRLMSIHASKGLEFDAVVLPDLDAPIASRSPGVLTERREIAGPIHTASLCPRRDLLRLDPTLSRLYAEWRRRVVREEICALYVATTRAVHALEFIIEPRDKDELPFSFSGILRGIVAPGPAPEQSTLWELGDPGWADSRARPASISIPDQPAAREESPPAPTRSAHPAHSAPPSPQEALPRSAPAHPSLLGLDWFRRTRFHPVLTPSDMGSVRSHRPPRRDTDSSVHARRVGTLAHIWLAAIGWLEDAGPTDDALVARIPPELRMSPDQTARTLAAFRAALQRPPLRAALARPDAASIPGGRADVWRELPFVMPSPRGIVSGRFDRVVALLEPSPATPTDVALARAASSGAASSIAALSPAAIRSIHIYDFKTSRTPAATPVPSANDSAAEPVADDAGHRGQLGAYEAAAAALFRVGPGRIRSSIIRVEMDC